MNWNRIKALALFFPLLLLAESCEEELKPSVVGKWEVFYINRGGTILGGRKFKGTTYVFRENGTVFAQTPNGDTLTSNYRHSGDTLAYLGRGLEEVYHLDTLKPERLVISAEIDGIPTEIRMLRVKN
jgi:hypothetical protein